MSLFLERPGSGERAVLIHIEFIEERDQEDPLEFEELVRSAGVQAVVMLTGSRDRPDSKHFIGKGKLEELNATMTSEQADVAIFNHGLSPSQQRNIERALGKRVIDRTGLILDIFAQRARTFEGKLQVELAQLQHLSTRLVRGWTHLERQKGGIGLRGPGEKQLESDRRLVRERIKSISKKLEKVRGQREQARRARARADMPTVSLVGYTNAGKSTLFNRLAHADVHAADQLFATLDPTLRRVEMPDYGAIVLADTVGFIRHLPHRLVEAFRATLEESRQAELLLHVIDASAHERLDNIYQVESVLKEIGADHIPCLYVFNKIDLMGLPPKIDWSADGAPERVWLSASTGAGVEQLMEAIRVILARDVVQGTLCIDAQMGRLRAGLYERGHVLSEQVDEDGMINIDFRISKNDYEQLIKLAGVRRKDIEKAMVDKSRANKNSTGKES